MDSHLAQLYLTAFGRNYSGREGRREERAKRKDPFFLPLNQETIRGQQLLPRVMSQAWDSLPPAVCHTAIYPLLTPPRLLHWLLLRRLLGQILPSFMICKCWKVPGLQLRLFLSPLSRSKLFLPVPRLKNHMLRPSKCLSQAPTSPLPADSHI